MGGSRLSDNDKNRALGPVLPPELLEALRQGGSQIDVNVLLVQIVKQGHDPQQIVEASEKMLAIARDYETQRVKDFTERANAVIDAKTRDPDEIDKRANNSVRRQLKILVGLLGVAQVVGGFTCAFHGSGIVPTGLLLSGGIFCVALIGMLASGESVSASDVVAVMRAVKGLSVEQPRKGKQK